MVFYRIGDLLEVNSTRFIEATAIQSVFMEVADDHIQRWYSGVASFENWVSRAYHTV